MNYVFIDISCKVDPRIANPRREVTVMKRALSYPDSDYIMIDSTIHSQINMNFYAEVLNTIP